jgi:hypothetical protein
MTTSYDQLFAAAPPAPAADLADEASVAKGLRRSCRPPAENAAARLLGWWRMRRLCAAVTEESMGKPKSLKDKLFGAAVLKMSFRLRGDEDSPAFQFVYPGVLRDLALEDSDVEKYISENRDAVEKAARGKNPPPMQSVK